MAASSPSIFASCPACKHSLPVIVGRKSTCRQVTCDSCGVAYDYSAWILKQPPAGSATVGLHTFYQVELFRIESEVSAAASVMGSVTSPRKTAAAQANGRKGGRPPMVKS